MLRDLVVPLAVAAFVVPGVHANHRFDELLRHQYEHFPDEWVRSGKPRGHSWIPPGGSQFSGNMALSRVSSDWWFDTPSWAAGDVEAMRLLRRWRKAAVVRWICLLAATAVCVAVYR